MQKVPSEAGEVAKRLAQVIFQVLEFLWSWSFGQIVAMFRLPLNTLPLWKQILFVLVLAALGYLFHKVSKDFLKAVQSVVSAVVGFGTAMIGLMPQIVWAGLIAFGGAWVMTNMNPTWIPEVLR
jgi:predicted membrane protein